MEFNGEFRSPDIDFSRRLILKTILIPIDDSSDAEWAATHVVQLYAAQQVRVLVLNVQAPLSRYVSRFINADEVRDFHQENGMRILKTLVEKLDAAGVPHTERVMVGHKAECIAEYAQANRCSRIVLPKKKNGMSLGLGSIGSQLRHLIGAEGSCDISEVY